MCVCVCLCLRLPLFERFDCPAGYNQDAFGHACTWSLIFSVIFNNIISILLGKVELLKVWSHSDAPCLGFNLFGGHLKLSCWPISRTIKFPFFLQIPNKPDFHFIRFFHLDLITLPWMGLSFCRCLITKFENYFIFQLF